MSKQVRNKRAPGLKSRERTQGRGLQQVAADIISLAILEEKDDDKRAELVGKINRRLWKGLYRRADTDDERQALNRNFGYREDEKPPRTLSSIHPDLLPELVEYLMKPAD